MVQQIMERKAKPVWTHMQDEGQLAGREWFDNIK